MRRKTGYELKENRKKYQFRFTSVGTKGSIEKIIEFSKIQKNLWNLAFGDIIDDNFDDSIISDNDDLRKVIQTVVNAVHIFIDNHSDIDILIAPSDYQRKLLYNRIFQQKWTEIDSIFITKGVIINDFETITENYNPKEMYDYFVIRRKNNIFEY
jgi:hypothetical protein